MIASFFAFVLAVSVAALLTPLVRDVARARGWLDRNDGFRKLHRDATPRLGGVAIVLAFYVPLIAIAFTPSSLGGMLFADQNHIAALAVGGLLIAALGIYDDLRGANAYLKFAVQFLVGAGVYSAGFRIENLTTPFGTMHLGAFGLPMTLVWIVGVTNAMNLIDGLDGLAGGVALIALIVVFVISGVRAQPLLMFFSASLAGAVLGFLFYNFNPATIFMGDAGSMFLGFMLATSSIRASHKSDTAVAIAVPIILLALPIGDTVLAMTRRAARGEQLFKGDREHVHHRLIALGLSPRRAVIVLYGACIICGLASLALDMMESHGVAVAIIGCLGVCFSAAAYRLWPRVSTRIAPTVFEDRTAVNEVNNNVDASGDNRSAMPRRHPTPTAAVNRFTSRS